MWTGRAVLILSSEKFHVKDYSSLWSATARRRFVTGPYKHIRYAVAMTKRRQAVALQSQLLHTAI
jgi:hypothetical protein